jgi:hypothetical protein
MRRARQWAGDQLAWNVVKRLARSLSTKADTPVLAGIPDVEPFPPRRGVGSSHHPRSITRTPSRKQRWRPTDYSRKGSMNRQHLTFLFEHHTKLLVRRKPPRGPLPVRCKRLRITCGSSRPSTASFPNATRTRAAWPGLRERRMSRRCCACNRLRPCDSLSLYLKPKSPESALGRSHFHGSRLSG